jgi:(S)-ureidoglycine aminohydrolase
VETTETGERRQLFEGASTPLAYLEIHATTLAPGNAPHAPHAHDDEEMVIIREGTLRVTIEDESKVLGAGSVALMLPGDEHGFENGGDTPVTYYVFRYRSKAPANVERGREAGGSLMLDWDDVAVEPGEKGARRSFFDRGTAMFERFEMHVTTLNEGLTSHAPHTHAAEEFILIRQSDVEESIDGTLHPATAGDLIFLASESLHGITSTGTGPAEYFAFQWE